MGKSACHLCHFSPFWHGGRVQYFFHHSQPRKFTLTSVCGHERALNATAQHCAGRHRPSCREACSTNRTHQVRYMLTVAHCARCSAAPQQKKKCGRKKGHIVGLGSPSKQWAQGGELDVPRSSRSRTTPKIAAETPGEYYHKVGWRGGAATPATLTVPKAAFQVPHCMPSALLILTKVLRRVCRRRQEHQHALLRT